MSASAAFVRHGTGACGVPMRCSGASGLLAWLLVWMLVVLPSGAVAQAGPAGGRPASAAMATGAERIVRVESEFDSPPLAIVNSDGSADGFSVQLFEAVARAAGLRYRIEVGPWDVIKDDVIAGKADLLVKMAISPERAKRHDFTAPYAILKAGVFVRSDSPALTSTRDLRDKSLLVVDGDSVHQWVARQSWGTRLSPVPTVGDAMQLLAFGKHDGVVVARLVGERALNQEHLDNIKLLGLALPGAEQHFAFAVKKGDAQLLAKLNEGLAIVHDDGTFSNLEHRWFDLSPPRLVPLRLLVRYGEPLLAAVLVLMTVIAYRLWVATAALRKERANLEATVDARTRSLRESEMRQKAIIDSALDGIVVYGPDGLIAQFNPAAERMFGYREQDVLGRDMADILSPADDEIARQRFKNRISRGLTVPEGRGEAVARHADGHKLFVEVSTARSDVGTQMLVTFFARDITQQKLAQTALEETTRAKAEFLNGATHELRTPLNGIIGFAELLKDEVPGPLNAEQAEFAADILASGQRMLALVEALLKVSDLQRRTVQLQREPLDAGMAIEERAGALRKTADARGITITLELAPDAGSAELDRDGLRRMLDALFDNAVKFSPDGGAVTVRLRRHQDGLEIAVSDTGIGIAPEDVARIFSPFGQVDGALGRAYGGIGLGLAMTRELAELHGGKVECESSPGQGSTFTLHLPLKGGDVV
jgi:PAS domain S-box-containing protein